MTEPVGRDRRALATHLFDQLDGAMTELQHWLDTGERVACPRCTKVVPATAAGEPVRHMLHGQWCEVKADGGPCLIAGSDGCDCAEEAS